jgi:membrane-associated protein
VVGGAAWVAIFCYVGYFFGNMPFVQKHFGLIAIAIIVISVLPAVVEVIRERSKARRAA